MGMTQTQKILAAHAGLAEVKAGQLINAKLDIVLGNDITTAAAQLVDRRVVTLDNAVNLGNVQAVVVAAQADRHVLVHFHKHLVGLAGSIGQMAGAGAEVEVAVADRKSTRLNSSHPK